MTKKGASTVEFLLASLIGLLLAAFMVSMLNSAAKILHAIKETYMTHYREAALRSRFEQILAEVDRHVLPLLPRLHRMGRITFVDTSINHISANNELQPSPESSAITYAALHFDLIQTIDGLEHEGTEVKSSACPMLSSTSLSAEFKSYLAFDTTHYFELIAIDKDAPSAGHAPSGCKSMYFSIPEKSMLGEQNDPPLISARHIVPISNIYTLYVDRNMTLRYASHRGTQIVENQPVLDDAGDLSISETYDQQSRLYQLSSDIKRKDTNEPIFLGVTRIPRASLIQLSLLQ